MRRKSWISIFFLYLTEKILIFSQSFLLRRPTLIFILNFFFSRSRFEWFLRVGVPRSWVHYLAESLSRIGWLIPVNSSHKRRFVMVLLSSLVKLRMKWSRRATSGVLFDLIFRFGRFAFLSPKALIYFPPNSSAFYDPKRRKKERRKNGFFAFFLQQS